MPRIFCVPWDIHRQIAVQKWFLKNPGWFTLSKSIDEGNLDVAMRLIERGHVFKGCASDACSKSAAAGSLALLHYFHRIGCPVQKKTIFISMNAGALECLLYSMYHCDSTRAAYHSNGPVKPSLPCVVALHVYNKNGNCIGVGEILAAYTSVECCGYIYQNKCMLSHIYLDPIIGAKFPCFLLAYQWQPSYFVRVLEKAAEQGAVCNLRYAHRQGHIMTTEVCGNAVITDSLDCLKYVVESNSPRSCSTVRLAAFYRAVKCFKYAIEQGFYCQDDLCDFVNDPECIEYLQSIGFASGIAK